MRRLVLGIAVAVTSLMPSFGMANDQQIADYIKGQLQVEQQQGNLRGFNVDMNVEGGTVWFKGYVANPQQEMTILRAAQQAGHLGVVQVVDDIEVSNQISNEQSQYATQAGQTYDQMGPEARPVAYQQPQFQTPQMTQPAMQTQASFSSQPTYAPESYVAGGEPLAFATAAGAPGMMGAPMPGGMGGMGGGLGAPMPAGMSGGGMGAPSGAPNLPGYAWPGYAAHPNFGGVSYPKQYSASAWPYIGPFYPYPQVPLGWRKVTLEWDDGFWQLDFNDK